MPNNNHFLERIGWIAVHIVASPLVSLFAFSLALINPLIVGFILGLGIGLAESVVILPWVNVGLWMIATSVGAGIGIFLALFLIISLSEFGGLLTGFPLGLTVGIFQWLVLKDKFEDASTWIILNCLSVGITFLAAYFITVFLVLQQEETLTNNQLFFFTILVGLIYGVISQYFLFKILNRPF